MKTTHHINNTIIKTFECYYGGATAHQQHAEVTHGDVKLSLRRFDTGWGFSESKIEVYAGHGFAETWVGYSHNLTRTQRQIFSAAIRATLRDMDAVRY